MQVCTEKDQKKVKKDVVDIEVLNKGNSKSMMSCDTQFCEGNDDDDIADYDVTSDIDRPDYELENKLKIMMILKPTYLTHV